MQAAAPPPSKGHRRGQNSFAATLILVAAVAMTGRAALPERVNREASQTLVDGRTTLAQIAATASPADASACSAR